MAAIKIKPLYVWILLPIIIVVSWIFGFYAPMSSRIDKADKDLTAVRAEKAVLQNEIGKLTALKRHKEEAQSKIDTMSVNIPKHDEIPDLMKDIMRTAKARGLLVEGFTSDLSSLDGRQSSLMVNPEAEIAVRGRYLQIGRFLDDLDNSLAFRGVVSARIAYEDRHYPVLTGIFVLQFKARRE